MVQHAQRLHRSRDDRLLFGVAGGLAEYFDVDPVLIRMGWILLVVATVGIALLFYIVLAMIVPNGRHPGPGAGSSEADASGDNSDTVVEDDLEQVPTKRHVARNVLGVGLIVVGMIILLLQLDVIGAIRWGIVWPVGIVLLGIAILRPTLAALHDRLRTSRNRSGDGVADDSSGSVVEADLAQDSSRGHVARDVLGIGLIVVGITILLHQLGVIGSLRWDIVWPVVIVLLGITILLPSAIASRR